MSKIAVIKNCLGAVFGAVERDSWGDYCDIITDGDEILVFENGGSEIIERYNGAEFKCFYGGEIKCFYGGENE